MVAFNNQVIQYLVIPSGATSGARIVIDGINGVILVYDSNNALIASVAPSPGTDPTGQIWVAGFGAYDDPTHMNYSQLYNGDLFLNTPLDSAAGGTGVEDSRGPVANQPVTHVFSPAYTGTPQPIAAFVDLFGGNVAQTRDPYVRLSMAGFSNDMNVLVAGQMLYSLPGNPNNGPETWHQPALNANWTNTGGTFGNFAYRRNVMGGVDFTGMIQWGAAATPAPDPVFTLPAGYRPNRTVHLAILSSPAAATNPTTETVEITTGGVVQITNYASGPNTPLSFEGLSFYLTAP